LPELTLDLTELLTYPIRTGIQRVEGELVKWWPADATFRIARFDPSRGLVLLPPGASRLLRLLFAATGAEHQRLAGELKDLSAAPANALLDLDSPSTRLLVPEVFYDPRRIAFYTALTPSQTQRVHFLVFDLLPLTHPAFFVPMTQPELTCAYFRLVRMASQVGFISGATRAAFHERLRRSPRAGGPVFYLGSDGLGPRPQPPPPPPAIPAFCVIGTIEPRKHHAAILDAFRAFQQERPDARLSFYGSLGWCTPQFRRTLGAANGRDGFRFEENPSDSAIREGVIGSTATIYASAAEGFGLPPVESLWLGAPVIAPPHIPSLENLGGLGVQPLASLDPDALLAAMRAVSIPSAGALLRDQAARLSLPTWQSFAEEVREWVMLRYPGNLKPT
jgi:glycosyltransferase involved in cell wall biosynthesis